MEDFSKFLSRNTVSAADTLPLVHTTRSFRLSKILHDKAIVPQICDVFAGEKLSYLFVERPAYKYEIEDAPDHWMLPTTFVFDLPKNTTKRIFPFDSGGFLNKRMPQFINEMDIEYFDVSSVSDAPEKMIGAFFGNAQNYMNFKGLSDHKFFSSFSLSPLDAEIHALHKLSLSSKSPGFDDRQFTIECQLEEKIEINENTLLAIIIPDAYLDDSKLVDYFEEINVEILSYETYPINGKFHFYAIYERIKALYEGLRII